MKRYILLGTGLLAALAVGVALISPHYQPKYGLSIPEEPARMMAEIMIPPSASAPMGGGDMRARARRSAAKALANQGVWNQLSVDAAPGPSMSMDAAPAPEFNTENYHRIYENPFLAVQQNPLSTFSIDVDAASYSNMRRFLTDSEMPPRDAVRIEEMINYFNYDYPQPTGNRPFSITTEVAAAPWQPEHRLVHIGLQGKSMPAETLPPSNLVFLMDVSGSMGMPDKMPLLKSAFRLLTDHLRPQDRVAIVVYAGAAGVVLPPTAGSDKAVILEAINRLDAGGSTAGGEGIELAYDLARRHFINKGNNRVILATDGDFNVGISSEAGLVRMIEEKRKDGIFLTVLGFGSGNLQDAMMEQLADKGNGNYAYIDNIMEARKVLVQEMGGTLFTIAKDVKIQVEFNPTHVQVYRLIGYENRLLASEDFNDDRKDAGELGAGHTVTALYEIIPPGVEFAQASVDSLKYQKPSSGTSSDSPEMLTVKLRFKAPDGDVSRLMQQALVDRDGTFAASSENFRFTAAVAEFGMLLRDSQHKGVASFDQVLDNARKAIGQDNEGYRAEFIRLAETARVLSRSLAVETK